MLLNALGSFGAALALTVATEAPVAWLFGLRRWKEQGIWALINVITNPTLNLLVNLLAYLHVYRVPAPYDPPLVAMECAVVAVEALLLSAALKKKFRKAIVLSLAANAASWLAGALFLWA